MTVEEGHQAPLDEKTLASLAEMKAKLSAGDPAYNEWVVRLDPVLPLEYTKAIDYLQSAHQTLINKLKSDKKVELRPVDDIVVPILNSRRRIATNKGRLSFHYHSNPQFSNESGIDIYQTVIIKGNKKLRLVPVRLYNTASLKPDGTLIIHKYPDKHGSGILFLDHKTFRLLPELEDWPDNDHYLAFLYAQDLIQTYLHWDSLPHKIIRTLRTLSTFGK